MGRAVSLVVPLLLVVFAGCVDEGDPGGAVTQTVTQTTTWQPGPNVTWAPENQSFNLTPETVSPYRWLHFQVDASVEGTVQAYEVNLSRSPRLPFGTLFNVVPLMEEEAMKKVVMWGVVLFDLSSGQADLAGIVAWTPTYFRFGTPPDVERTIAYPDYSASRSAEPDLYWDAYNGGGRIGVLVFANATEPVTFDAALRLSAGYAEPRGEFEEALEEGAVYHMEPDGMQQAGFDFAMYLASSGTRSRIHGTSCDVEPEPVMASISWGPVSSTIELYLDVAGTGSGCGFRETIEYETTRPGWTFAHMPFSYTKGEYQGTFDVQGMRRSVNMTIEERIAIVLEGEPGLYSATPYMAASGDSGSRVTVVNSHNSRVPFGYGDHFLLGVDVPFEEWFGMPAETCWSHVNLATSLAAVDDPSTGPSCYSPRVWNLRQERLEREE